MMELFCDNSLKLSAIDCFSKKRAIIDLIQGPKLSDGSDDSFPQKCWYNRKLQI